MTATGKMLMASICFNFHAVDFYVMIYNSHTSNISGAVFFLISHM